MTAFCSKCHKSLYPFEEWQGNEECTYCRLQRTNDAKNITKKLQKGDWNHN